MSACPPHVQKPTAHARTCTHTPLNITRDVLTVSGLKLLNQGDTFTDDTFITINQGNLIKKVVPPPY